MKRLFEDIGEDIREDIREALRYVIMVSTCLIGFATVVGIGCAVVYGVFYVITKYQCDLNGWQCIITPMFTEMQMNP